MTTPRKTPRNYVHASTSDYCGKPKAPDLKIVRSCLNCGKSFTAPSKFIRLCELHRDGRQ